MAGSTDDFSDLSNDVGNLFIALANAFYSRKRKSLTSFWLSFHVPGLDKNLLLAISKKRTITIVFSFLRIVSFRI